MQIDYEKSGSCKAFVELDKGEEYPDTIKYFLKTENKHRIFKKHVCKVCGIVYYRKNIKNTSEYCSDYCSHIDNTVIIKCNNCGKEKRIFNKRIKRSKYKIFFCSRKCKDFAQSIDGNCIEIRPPHYGDGNSVYAERAFRHQKEICGYNFCEICGEKDILYLLVHHKDCNRKHNKIENLQVLCANHHIKWHRLNAKI